MTQSQPLYTTKYIWKRMFAGIIDYLISLSIIIFTSILCVEFASEKETRTVISTVIIWILGIILVDLILFAIYPLKFNGQTLGKHILRLKVISREGKSPDLITLLSRRFLQCLILIFLPISALVFLFRRDKQNLWDMVSSTYVVDKKIDSLPIELLPKKKAINSSSILIYRYGAFLYDNILIINILFVIVATIAMLPESMRAKHSTLFTVVIVLILLGVGYILRPIYEVICYKIKGQTIGKNIFGTKIINYKTKENLSTSKIILREVLKFIFYSVLGSFLPILVIEGVKVHFDPEKRSFLDRVSGSQVINTKGGKKYPGRYLIVLIFFSFILLILLGLLFFARYGGELDKTEDQKIIEFITPTPTPNPSMTLIPTPTKLPTPTYLSEDGNSTNSPGISNIYTPQERNGNIIDIKDRGANGKNYLTINEAEIGLENIYSAEWCKDQDLILFTTGLADDATNRYYPNTDIWITDTQGNATLVVDFGERPNSVTVLCDRGIIVYGTKDKVSKVNTDGTNNVVLMEFAMVNTQSEFFILPEIITIDATHVYVRVPDEFGDYIEFKIDLSSGRVESL